MTMQDHIVAVKSSQAAAIMEDWYNVHRLLTGALGERTTGAGEAKRTRWQFAMDPRAVLHQPNNRDCFIAIRTCGAEIAPLIAPLSICNSETWVPEAGAKVRFWLNVSDAVARHAVDHTAWLLSQERPKIGRRRVDGLRESLSLYFLERTGLTPERDSVTVRARRFPVAKGRSAFVKTGLMVGGVAQIASHDALVAALHNGVGRDRGFGFGMLIVEAI